MLTLEILHQQKYSRGQLLLRTFFGWLYIAIPHFFLLMFSAFVMWILTIVAFFNILIDAVTPKWYYEWTVKLNRWGLRIGARILNLVDGYPEFGMEGNDDKTSFDLEFWQISRRDMLLRTFLGWLYVGIPHGFILYFRGIGTLFLLIFAFFSVLFTREYPENWHRFNVGTIRWGTRVNLYQCWLYKDYPPFTGKPDEKNSFEFETLKTT